jgi:hypothetical protein
MAGILKLIEGAAEVAAGIAIDIFAPGAAEFGDALIGVGVGTMISGVGSLIQGDPVKGFGTTMRNPIAPWRCCYGRQRTGGTLVYMHQWGNNKQVLDMVIVLAAHPCESVDELLFDQQRVQIDTSAIPNSAGAGYTIPAPEAGSGTSFSPLQQTNVPISSISRAANVVTVVLSHDIPYLTEGDQIGITNANGGGILDTYALTGVFQVAEIISRVGGVLTFTYLSGGVACFVSNEGGATTQWADYGRNVYMEVLSGKQLLGETFIGATAGVPWQGTGKLCTPASPQQAGGSSGANPWTNYCSLQGKTAVFLRITLDTNYFGSGLPMISFYMRGKNDIYDPRLGALSGIGAAGLAAAGSGYHAGGMYQAGDVLTVTQSGASGGQITVTAVDGSGAITAFVVTAPGSGYSIASGLALSGGHGSSATVNITLLTGAAGSCGYSENAALCIADFLADQTWGYKAQYGTDIPADALTAAANVCDQAVSLAIGGSEPRYACNGQFEVTTKRGETLQNLLTSCAGRISPEAPFVIQPGYWVGPTLPAGIAAAVLAAIGSGYQVGDVLTVVQSGASGGQITVDAVNSTGGIIDYHVSAAGSGYSVANGLAVFGGHGTLATFSVTMLTGGAGVNLQAIAAGAPHWRPTSSIRDLFNGCKGTYISPANKWQSTDFPAYAQDSMHGYSGPLQYGGDVLLAADAGERRWLELHLPFTISAPTAQRIAKIELLRRRNGGTGTFPLNMAGYQFAPLDVFEATVPFLGFAGKLLEVQSTRFRIDAHGDTVTLGTEIDVQETDSSIYNWSTEEELSAQGYVQGSWGTGTFAETVPLPWSPGHAAPIAGDAIGGPASFGIQPVFGLDVAGNATAAVQIKGAPPVNVLDNGVARPQLTCVPSNTGGSIPAGTYVVGLAARDGSGANYHITDYLSLAVVVIGGPGTGSVAVTANWGSGDDGGDLYMAALRLDAYGGELEPNGYTMHWQQTMASGATSATIASFNQVSAGGPDPLFDHFDAAWKQIVHAGVWAQQVQALSPGTSGNAGYIQFADPAPTSPPTPGMTTGQWDGYVLTLLAKNDQTAEVPLLNLAVAASGASSSGVFVVTIGPGADGNLPADVTTLLEVGDLLVMRHKATFTATGFSDSNIANEYYPAGATAVEAGHVAVVLSGPDKGDVQTIKDMIADSNGNYTIFELAGSWLVTPNAGDIVIIVAPGEADSPSISMSVPGPMSGVMATVNALNLAWQQWLFLVRACDPNGNCGPDLLVPMREIYLEGSSGALALVLNVVVAGGSPATLTPDAVGTDGARLTVLITQDSVGYPIPWGASFKWAPEIPVAPDTESLVQFAGRSSDGNWYCTSYTLGMPI